MAAFDLLTEDVLSVLAELGIENETRAQEQAIPPIMKGEHTLVIAPTGVGKTEAAVLPILEEIHGEEGPGFKVLYITPLRALNRDMVRRIEFFAERLDFSVAVRHGDTSRKERRRQSLNPPDFMITTPETLQIMFTGHRLRSALVNVRFVVVDELNELAVDERGTQLSLALERLERLKNGSFQRIGLSATVGSPEKVLQFLVGSERKGKIIEIEGQGKMTLEVTKPDIKKSDEKLAETLRSDVEKAACVRICKELIDKHQSTLIFVNTRDAAESLASSFNLWDPNYPIGIHHGSLYREARMDVEDRFKDGDLKALICTSSMELGIDLGETDLVIQYQSPRQVTRLVQRVGRSGHSIGKTSKGIILATTHDDIAESAVIARRSLIRDLEKTDIPEKPMSVLANQLISTVHSEGKVNIYKFFEMVRRAYPFRNLTFEEYEKTVAQLSEIRVLWRDEDVVGKRRASLTYFYENISMIPDEKTFLLRDLSKNSIVGTLDESFVASNVELGGVITLQGKAWRVIDIEEEEVVASPVGDLGKIPDWTGEDIPVPFEVAQEVGKIRKIGLNDKYKVNKKTQQFFYAFLKEQGTAPIATDKDIIIEKEGDTVVINASFGSMVNETLGRFVATLLSARTGESVGLQTDPYRMMMKISRRVTPSMIKEALEGTDPEHLEGILRKAVVNSSFFRWRFLHVAKKYGAVKKDIDYRSISLKRLMDAYRSTPMYQEALEKVFRDNMDIETSKHVMDMIKRGGIKVKISTFGLSPVGEAGLQKHKEMLDTSKVSRAVLSSFKDRLYSETLTLKCLKCGNSRRRRVKDINRPSCPSCGSRMVATLLPYQDESIVDKGSLSEEEKSTLREYFKLADLARVYGKRAAMAIAARGVGHDKAARILSMDYREEDDFLKALLDAEIQYARTKKFWD